MTGPIAAPEPRFEFAETVELSTEAIEALAALLLEVTESAGCLKDKKQVASP
jgi:hypothetical protein